MDGKCGYGFAIWFNSLLVGVGAVDDPKVTSYKEIEVRAILAVVFEVRARDFSKVHVLSDLLIGLLTPFCMTLSPWRLILSPLNFLLFLGC